MNSNEIDLFKLLIRTILFFRKHYKILFISIFLGLIIGISINRLTKKKYFSAYLIAETSLSDVDIFEVVKSIKYSVAQHDYYAIQKKLNISKKSCSRIKEIEIQNVLIASGWDMDGAVTGQVKSKLFRITLDFNTSSKKDSIQQQYILLDSIQRGVVKYVNNNPYISERQQYSKVLIKNMISEIAIQLKKLDTLQKSVIEQKPQRGQVVVDNAYKQSFSSDILSLLERKLKLEESYQLDSPIMIVENFNCTLVIEPGISNGKIILICFVFFVLTLMYLCIAEMKELIKSESVKDNV